MPRSLSQTAARVGATPRCPGAALERYDAKRVDSAGQSFRIRRESGCRRLAALALVETCENDSNYLKKPKTGVVSGLGRALVPAAFSVVIDPRRLRYERMPSFTSYRHPSREHGVNPNKIHMNLENRFLCIFLFDFAASRRQYPVKAISTNASVAPAGEQRRQPCPRTQSPVTAARGR